MTATPLLQTHFPENAYLSSASQDVVRPTLRLLLLDLEEWIPASTTEIYVPLFFGTVAYRFRDLAMSWRKECTYLSSVREMVLHPAYQQIIGMGKSALPFIFRELETHPDHWFWALWAITGEDPVPPEDKGKIQVMTHHWLCWARRRGYYSTY